MQVVDLIQNIFKSWFVLVRFCTNSPINTPTCVSLWVYMAMASSVAGVLLLTWSALKVIRHYAAVKAGAERAPMAADEETVKEFQRAGDPSLEDDAAFEERIRELLAARKLADEHIAPEKIRPLKDS